jgi:hypothetical protein
LQAHIEELRDSLAVFAQPKGCAQSRALQFPPTLEILSPDLGLQEAHIAPVFGLCRKKSTNPEIAEEDGTKYGT